MDSSRNQFDSLSVRGPKGGTKMAQRFGSAVGRTLSRLASARALVHTAIDEGDANQSALESEIRLAAYADVPVLVTAETLSAAKRVVCAIQERLQESERSYFAVVNSSLSLTRLVELLTTRSGSIVFEDVGAFGDQAQAVLLQFLDSRLDSRSGDPRHLRIISTGLIDLYTRVKAGKFRDVLFYRLNTIHISVSSQATFESF
jgi:transcriptional regulator of acetoin/glycerol metabolism